MTESATTLLSQRFVRWKPVTIAVSLALILGAGVLDYATGREIIITPFYLLPMCWMSWVLGRRAGLFLGVVGTAVWLMADMAVKHDYPISKQFREQAQATGNISFRTICENPDAYKGRMVIWGGRILKTVNETNGDFFTVLQAPLDYQERPGSTKLSQGRFIVRSSGFLDSEVYGAGAIVTVAGELAGVEAQIVGNRSYAFPVVMLRDVYFWRPESAVPESPVYYVTPSFWGWGWYEPFWPYDDGFHSYYYWIGTVIGAGENMSDDNLLSAFQSRPRRNKR